ncbi:MAG: hypothetical protein IJ963_04095 [Phascolarctobacterium sp.]|nr:hypothetical protein [Phascolarctobacterium sp.]
MPRRVCKLTDKSQRNNVDLRNYSQTIINTINKIAPNKNPTVNQHSFSTDPLTHSEAVKLGFALAEIPEIAELGIWVKTFRLFDGRIIEDKKEKRNDSSNDKKVSNNRRNPQRVPTSKQEKNTCSGETVS